ncbi:hypothetical protein SH501x_004360 [Pirellulaceae bacterium SH501]
MIRFLCMLATFGVLAGCGGGLIPIKTAKVTGTATFNGKPLEDYKVYFYCEQAEAKEPATGIVAADGTFTLGVRTAGDGAIVGSNKIWLTYDPPVPKEVAGSDAAWNPPPPKVKLPEKYMSMDTSGLSVEVPSSGLADYKIELK